MNRPRDRLQFRVVVVRYDSCHHAAVADFHDQRVDVQDRVKRVQRPCLPRDDLSRNRDDHPFPRPARAREPSRSAARSARPGHRAVTRRPPARRRSSCRPLHRWQIPPAFSPPHPRRSAHRPGPPPPCPQRRSPGHSPSVLWSRGVSFLPAQHLSHRTLWPPLTQKIEHPLSPLACPPGVGVIR